MSTTLRCSLLKRRERSAVFLVLAASVILVGEIAQQLADLWINDMRWKLEMFLFLEVFTSEGVWEEHLMLKMRTRAIGRLLNAYILIIDGLADRYSQVVDILCEFLKRPLILITEIFVITCGDGFKRSITG